VLSLEWVSSLFELLQPLLPVLNALEPDHPKRLFLTTAALPFSFHSYSLSIARWKGALLNIVPHLRRQITTLEQCHRIIGPRLLDCLDILYISADKMTAAFLLSWYYDDICSMRSLDTLDSSACDHISCALEHRLALLYDLIFTKVSATKTSHRRELKEQALMLRRCSNANIFVPSEYQSFHDNMQWASRYESSNFQCRDQEYSQDHSSRKKVASFCSWVNCCIPPGYWEMFGLDTENFCKEIHDAEQIHDPNAYDLASLYDSVASNDPYLFPLLATAYRNAIAFMLQMYLSCLLTEATSSTEIARHKPKIIWPQEILFMAMPVCFHFLKWCGGQKNLMDQDFRKTMGTWIREDGPGKAIEALLKEAPSKVSMVYVAEQEQNCEHDLQHDKSLHATPEPDNQGL
jgi:hypothetical protein